MTPEERVQKLCEEVRDTITGTDYLTYKNIDEAILKMLKKALSEEGYFIAESWKKELDMEVEIEREACAKIADDSSKYGVIAANEIAQRIRARGAK